MGRKDKRPAKAGLVSANAGAVTEFSALGVFVRAGTGDVYAIDYSPAKWNIGPRRLGRLAGATAQVTDSTSAFSPGKALLMPLVITPLARKQVADAVIRFADGSLHVQPLDGSGDVRDARRECVEFNALAGRHTKPSKGDADPAARLRKLQELLDGGLISAEEFAERRASIIRSV